jgi:hypothetical protein
MDTTQTEARMRQLAGEASALFDKADAEGRPLTPDEREEAEDKMRRFKDLRSRQQAFEVASQLGAPDSEGWTFGGDAGKAFTASQGYKAIRDPAMRGQTFTSGAVEVPLMTKGTLLEGPGAPGTGTGGGLLPVPDVRPGVVQKLLAPPLGVADLFGQATATTNTVRYVVEGTATSAAAGVAEGAAKPESTLALSTPGPRADGRIPSGLPRGLPHGRPAGAGVGGLEPNPEAPLPGFEPGFPD